MKLLLLSVFLAISASGSQLNLHEAGHNQIPLDYVKFPFEPPYRGVNGEGDHDLIDVRDLTESCLKSPQMLSSLGLQHLPNSPGFNA
jgi:hypothetical protein